MRSATPRLAGGLDGLAAIAESHFSSEERRITAALDRLPGTAPGLLGIPEVPGEVPGEVPVQR